jgi:hypothetical protein
VRTKQPASAAANHDAGMQHTPAKIVECCHINDISPALCPGTFLSQEQIGRGSESKTQPGVLPPGWPGADASKRRHSSATWLAAKPVPSLTQEARLQSPIIGSMLYAKEGVTPQSCLICVMPLVVSS